MMNKKTLLWIVYVFLLVTTVSALNIDEYLAGVGYNYSDNSFVLASIDFYRKNKTGWCS